MTNGLNKFCSKGRTFEEGLTASILYIPLLPRAIGVKAEAGNLGMEGAVSVDDSPTVPV